MLFKKKFSFSSAQVEAEGGEECCPMGQNGVSSTYLPANLHLNTELIVSRLFVERLLDDEAVLVVGRLLCGRCHDV